MADKPYTKREIDQIFGNFVEKFSTFDKDTRESLTRIENQTTATNGRVRRLERWQSYVIGFCACLSLILFSAVIPIVAAYIQAARP
jgi:hypothetical protein